MNLPGLKEFVRVCRKPELEAAYDTLKQRWVMYVLPTLTNNVAANKFSLDTDGKITEISLELVKELDFLDSHYNYLDYNRDKVISVIMTMACLDTMCGIILEGGNQYDESN